MLFFCAGTLLCTGVTMVVVNSVCHRNAAAWIPIYPDSEVISQSYTFAEPFGVGITQMRLYTPDSPVEVRQWYIDERSKNEPNPTNLLATMSYRVLRGSDGGSEISLNSECAWR
jgi:hypothetical protein